MIFAGTQRVASREYCPGEDPPANHENQYLSPTPWAAANSRAIAATRSLSCGARQRKTTTCRSEPMLSAAIAADLIERQQLPYDKNARRSDATLLPNDSFDARRARIPWMIRVIHHPRRPSVRPWDGARPG